MDITTTDGDNFPCQCHLSQYAYTDDLCPECAERQRAEAAPVDYSERHLSPEYQEEQYSARYEDRYGYGDPGDWED
jgi:hypothetical protein